MVSTAVAAALRRASKATISSSILASAAVAWAGSGEELAFAAVGGVSGDSSKTAAPPASSAPMSPCASRYSSCCSLF